MLQLSLTDSALRTCREGGNTGLNAEASAGRRANCHGLETRLGVDSRTDTRNRFYGYQENPPRAGHAK
jgi:hypothetical protein